MKKGNPLFCLLLFTVLVVGVPSTGPARQQPINADTADLIGAGATFPAPLYQRWIKEFSRTPDAFSIFYDAVGSGDGIRRFMAESVDFGASDAAMNDEQISSVERGVKLIPATAGIIALAYHLPGIDNLRLSREVYSDIFLGNIQSWDNPRIQDLNPDVRLPRLTIVTITRSDSSGTTWAFTNHLNTIFDPDKADKVKRFLNWGLVEGQKFASEYGYAPLPQPVAGLALDALTDVQ